MIKLIDYINNCLEKVEKEYGAPLRKIIAGILDINSDQRKSMSQTKVELEQQFQETYMVLGREGAIRFN